MSKSGDARAALQAALNHLPETADVTRAVAGAMLAGSRVSPDAEDAELERIKKVIPILIYAVMSLENRIEILEGREGFADQLIALMTEFMSI